MTAKERQRMQRLELENAALRARLELVESALRGGE